MKIALIKMFISSKILLKLFATGLIRLEKDTTNWLLELCKILTRCSNDQAYELPSFVYRWLIFLLKLLLLIKNS